MSDPSGKVTLSLGDVAAEIYASLDPASTIAAITRAAIGALGADRATTYVTDEAGLITEVHTTEDDPRVRSFIERSVGRPMEEMPVWAALGAQQDPVMLVQDVATTLGQEFADHIRVTSFAGVRLERRDGAEFLGGIFCSFRSAHEFSEDERGAVRTLGALASLALSNARLFQRTDRDMQEARAIAEAQRAFRLMAENSSDVITRADANGVIGYMSPAALRVLELSPSDAIGRSLPALLGLDSAAELTAGETVISRLPREDAEVWVETSARRVGDPLSGDVVEIHASTRDVTSRQRAREELRAVAAEQAALRRVTSSAAEGMSASETWAVFTGELGALVDATGAWVLRADGDQAEVVAAWSAGGGALEEGQVITADQLGPVAAAMASAAPADGRFHLDGSPLCGPAGCFSVMPVMSEGQLWGLVGMTDGSRVTNVRNRGHLRAFTEVASAILTTFLARAERDEMEGELRHSQKLEAVGQLAAGIAHEINTPIQFVGDSVEFLRDAFDDMRGLLEQYRALAETAATGGAAELTEKLAEADDEADLEYLLEQVPKAIERTLDGAGRVAEIVRAMKEFAHPRRDSQAPADLNRAIQSTATVARNELKYVADVAFELADLPPVVCHLGDVNQVVLNLMVNAAHAIADRTAAGGPDRGLITVSTALSDDAQWVTISIADTGGGIPDEVRERIFEPFFTTKEVGKGTGQGLAIAARVCEAHGGSLTFDTTLGEGTTFHLRLPVDGTGEPLELPA